MNQMQPDNYLQCLYHGPSIRLCDYARGTSDLVIKTLVCLLKTDVTNTLFFVSTNSSSYIYAHASVL